MTPLIRTGVIKSPNMVTTEKPTAATTVVTKPQRMQVMTKPALLGSNADSSGGSTLKMTAKAVALTVNLS
jgi:hypothetical protein